MNYISVSVEDGCPSPVWLADIEPFAAKTLARLGIDGWELSVLFCRAPFIADLNRRYRGVDGASDVLSFENGAAYTAEDGEKLVCAGDIVISVDTLAANAREFAVPLGEELRRLLIHGILHLAGHDHPDNSPEQPMLALQEALLAELAPQFRL
jgi:probable rRNA maturation factor